jgi:ornithine decarboxylase
MTKPPGRSWTDLAATEPTPYFVLVEERLERRYGHFARFGDVRYPMKSNPHEFVLGALARLGSGFDVDSVAHAQRLLGLGVSVDSIQFGLPIAKAVEWEGAAKLGIRRFVVESEDAYERISEICPDGEYIVRLNPFEFLPRGSLNAWKWGASRPEALKLVRTIQGGSGACLGVSFYLSEDDFSIENLATVLAGIAEEFADHELKLVNIGGGLDDSESADFGESLVQVRAALNLTDVVLEPGRNLIGPAFDLVASVVDIRQRGGVDWAYIDVGIYSGLLDAALRHRTYRISKIGAKKSGPSRHRYQIAGPTADGQDRIGEYELPEPLQRGDRLVFRGVGAYTLALATDFSGFGVPRVFAVETDYC